MEIIIILGLGILIAVYNGYFILDQNQRIKKKNYNRKFSDIWHGIGLFMRALMMLYFLDNFFYFVLQGFIVGVLYDIIINIIIKKPWYYQGKTSVMDRNIPPGILTGVKLVWTIITIIEIVKLWHG